MNMKTTYKIIDAKDFIKANPTGEVDLEQSKQILIELAAIAQPPADYEILLDIREVNNHLKYCHLNYCEIYQFVEELGRHRSAFRNKIAVLARPDNQFDRACFMELCAKNRGFQVGAFTDFEKTIEWLNENLKVHSA